jgi:hypothetical protein
MMRQLLVFYLLGALLFGVELLYDRTYTGPKKLTVSSLGVSMGLPHDWSAVARQGEGVTLFQNKTEDTIVMRAKTLNKLKAINYLNAVHYLKNGVKIFPRGRVVKLGSHMYRRVYAADADASRSSVLIYVVLGPQERGVVMQAQYDTMHDSAIKVTTMHIAQTLSFTPLKQLKSALDDIEMRLKGAHVVYAKREGTYDEERELWLCSNGRYMLNAQQTVAEGLSRVERKTYGQWSVDGSFLLLNGDDGLDRRIEVKIQDSVLLFDGQRSYELANHQCR